MQNSSGSETEKSEEDWILENNELIYFTGIKKWYIQNFKLQRKEKQI